MLQSEHRAAPASPPCHLELVAADAETARPGDRGRTPEEAERGLRGNACRPVAGGEVFWRASLRDSLAVKNERLGAALESLERGGRLCTRRRGWQRTAQRRGAFPFPPEEAGKRTGREPRGMELLWNEEHHARRRLSTNSREIPMEQVLALLGFAPTSRSGVRWYGRCPFAAAVHAVAARSR